MAFFLRRVHPLYLEAGSSAHSGEEGNRAESGANFSLVLKLEGEVDFVSAGFGDFSLGKKTLFPS